MSLINIQGGDILVKSVEIYGSGIVQTTAQTGGVSPPIISGGYTTFTDTTVGSAAVNPTFITSQNVYGGGGLAYIVSLNFDITAQSGFPPLAGACKLVLNSTTVGLEEQTVGIETNQTIIGGAGNIPSAWSDMITFLYYPDGVFGTLNTIEFGLTATGYDPIETFNCVYDFNWVQIAN
jgi:hypothetical protein